MSKYVVVKRDVRITDSTFLVEGSTPDDALNQCKTYGSGDMLKSEERTIEEFSKPVEIRGAELPPFNEARTLTTKEPNTEKPAT